MHQQPRDDRPGRTAPLAIRRASGLSFPNRVDLQVDRDALLHRLEHLDAQLLELSDERKSIVDALTSLRDTLYPPVPWCHGRRPPDIDRGPLPPAPDGATLLSGRMLRATCLTILRRHGPTSLVELHGLLHRYGYIVDARRPVTTLSDAMAYEVERGRARRLDRGVYEAVTANTRRRSRRPEPVIAASPEPWLGTAPSILDPALDEDPPFWTHHRRW